MNEAEIGQTGIDTEKALDSELCVTSEGKPYLNEMDLKPLPGPDKLSIEIEHFCNLSAEMAGFLTRLPEEARRSVEQLGRINSAVDIKKKELKTLLGIEASAEMLERLSQDYRQQKENFERLILEQQTFLENEKLKRTQEEKEYQENLQIRRQHEEEEYQQIWAAEKLKSQQKLEEELNIIRQEALNKQQAMEKEYLDRELTLKQKELEWDQLVQELEQFMTALATRVRASARSEPIA